MFDYSTLVSQVRRTLGDSSRRIVEEATIQNTSYYITLQEEGYATIVENGLMINDEIITEDMYEINKNVIKMSESVDAGAIISVEYDIVEYSDELILEYIGDTIENYIQPLLNTDFGFGKGENAPTKTSVNITFNESSLFVHGTVLSILGVNLLDVAGDAIFIKDGDTTVRTDVSSQQASKVYNIAFTRFMHLLKTIRINTFQGEVIHH